LKLNIETQCLFGEIANNKVKNELLIQQIKAETKDKSGGWEL
jgi:hypothetical protein